MDMPCKVALKNIMESKGYSLVGDIEKEEYKKYDLMFQKGDKKLTFENEMRKPFYTILKYYDTVHIPIRKANNQSNWYALWNLECSEFLIIRMGVIRHLAKESVVDIDCNKGTEYNYVEKFIDVPTKMWRHVKVKDII